MCRTCLVLPVSNASTRSVSSSKTTTVSVASLVMPNHYQTMSAGGSQGSLRPNERLSTPSGSTPQEL